MWYAAILQAICLFALLAIEVAVPFVLLAMPVVVAHAVFQRTTAVLKRVQQVMLVEQCQCTKDA